MGQRIPLRCAQSALIFSVVVILLFIWALVLGLNKTASTFFFMDEGVDSGDILSQKPLNISENDDAAMFDPKDIDQQKILDEVKLVFENRVKTVDKQEQVDTLKHIESLIRKWEQYKKTYKTTLKYQEYTFDKISKELRKSFWYLLKSDPASTRQLIPTPRSLRNAEQEQKLFYFQKRVLEE